MYWTNDKNILLVKTGVLGFFCDVYKHRVGDSRRNRRHPDQRAQLATVSGWGVLALAVANHISSVSPYRCCPTGSSHMWCEIFQSPLGCFFRILRNVPLLDDEVVFPF